MGTVVSPRVRRALSQLQASAVFVSRATPLSANPTGLCFQLGVKKAFDDVKSICLGLRNRGQDALMRQQALIFLFLSSQPVPAASLQLHNSQVRLSPSREAAALCGQCEQCWT